MRAEESIEVAVPVHTAYCHWARFTSFPEFMDGVVEVRQIDDITTHWVTEIGGLRREFVTIVTEQRPNQRIAWTSITGPRQQGGVSFQPIDDQHTRIQLELYYQPESLTEKIGDRLGLIRTKARQDLDRFANFVERRAGSGTADQSDQD